MHHNRKKEAGISLGVLLALALIVAASLAFNHKTKVASTVTTTPTTITTTPSPAMTDTSSTTATSTSVYKDGTYSATGTYTSPDGTDKITISLTVANDIITGTSATEGSTNGESKEYQDDFVSGYKSLVIGKSLGSVSLSRVSGSSLTSEGFNSAVTQIKATAKA